MADQPWQGDACSLVEMFRAGERSPSEELAATYAAIDDSDLNAFSHLHREQAEAAAAVADVSKPLGGVPIGVKELDQVEGWPDTHACVLYRDAIAPHTGTNPGRARDRGGAVLIGQTTASEFGGVNLTVDRMSAPYVQDATIDFVDSIEKQGFTIDNPNAGSACACGGSFS